VGAFPFFVSAQRNAYLHCAPARQASSLNAGAPEAPAIAAVWLLQHAHASPRLQRRSIRPLLLARLPRQETNFSGNARQRRLRFLAPRFELLGWLGSLLSCLPLALRMAFVRANVCKLGSSSSSYSRVLKRPPVLVASAPLWSAGGLVGERSLSVIGCKQ
jgi:hypothetical protein